MFHNFIFICNYVLHYVVLLHKIRTQNIKKIVCLSVTHGSQQMFLHAQVVQTYLKIKQQTTELHLLLFFSKIKSNLDIITAHPC